MARNVFHRLRPQRVSSLSSSCTLSSCRCWEERSPPATRKVYTKQAFASGYLFRALCKVALADHRIFVADNNHTPNPPRVPIVVVSSVSAFLSPPLMQYLYPF